jgi:hypothetical protein
VTEKTHRSYRRDNVSRSQSRASQPGRLRSVTAFVTVQISDDAKLRHGSRFEAKP